MSTFNIDLESKSLSFLSDFRVGGIYGYDTYFYDALDMAEELTKLINKGNIIAAHNLISFDAPFLCHKELNEYGESPLLKAIYRNEGCLVDTLVLSRTWRAGSQSHSMRDWISLLQKKGVNIENKVEVEDFANDPIHVIEDRLKYDLKAQHEITKVMKAKFGNDLSKAPLYSKLHYFFSSNIDSLARGIPVREDLKSKVTNELCFKKAKLHSYLKNNTKIDNLNSNMQVDKYLKEVYGKGLPLGEPSEITQKRSSQLNKDNRHLVASEFPIVESIMKWRDLNKQLEFIKPDTKKSIFMEGRYCSNRVYPSLSLMSQISRRSNYTSPALSQMDVSLRELISDNDYWFVRCDLKSLEVSTLGHLAFKETGDRTILNEVTKEDAHQKTINIFRNLLYNIPKDKWRLTCKIVYFAKLYGAGVSLIMKTLKLPEKEKNNVYKAIDKRFSAVKTYEDSLQKYIKGNVLWNYYNFPIMTKDHTILNNQVQSTASIFAYLMFDCLYQELKIEFKDDFRPVLQLHDEVCFLISKEYFKDDVEYIMREDILPKTYKRFKEKKCGIMFTDFDFAVGENWASVK